MVGIYSRRNVSVKIAARQGGGMTVYLFMMALRRQNFVYHVFVAVDYSYVIHHFRKAEDSGVAVKFVYVLVRQRHSVFVHRGGRYAGGKHKHYVKSDVFRCFQHITYSVGTHYVCDFVRVGDDGGRAVPKRYPRKFGRSNYCAFKMNVRVNKPGYNVPSAGVYFTASFVFSAYTRNQSARNRNVALLPGGRKYVKISCVFYGDVRFFLSPRDFYQGLFFMKLSLYSFLKSFHDLHRPLL